MDMNVNGPPMLGMPGGEWPMTREWAERSRGWAPLPFQVFVLKIHSRCDLSCDYCYVYQQVDQSWRGQPKVMSREVIDKAASRIGEHAHTHRLAQVSVVLHGGEPLLAGAAWIAYAAETLRKAVPPATQLQLTVTTNGVGLADPEVLRVLHQHRIRVAVSLDGDRAAHDRHRRYANGRGSYDDVVAGLSCLLREPYQELFAGLLATIDLENDPIAVYEGLAAFDPPRMDLLLPHGTWASPPPDRVEGSPRTPYADWLIAVFDRWVDAGDRAPGVRLFESIIDLLLGGPSWTEAIGPGPVRLLVIETNGGLQQVDTLKAAFHGAPELRIAGRDEGPGSALSVLEHELDVALRHPAVIARQVGKAALCDTCLACPVVEVCGGGSYAHRHRPGSGFLNPSVYHPDLLKLIEHIKGWLTREWARVSQHR